MNKKSYKVPIDRHIFFRSLKRHRFTELTIAEAIGVSSKTIQRAVTSGEIDPYYLEQIAAVLHESPYYISGQESNAVTSTAKYTKDELNVFLNGISLRLLSLRSAQYWKRDDETSKEINWLEKLYEKVRKDIASCQD